MPHRNAPPLTRTGVLRPLPQAAPPLAAAQPPQPPPAAHAAALAQSRVCVPWRARAAEADGALAARQGARVPSRRLGRWEEDSRAHDLAAAAVVAAQRQAVTAAHAREGAGGEQLVTQTRPCMVPTTLPADGWLDAAAAAAAPCPAPADGAPVEPEPTTTMMTTAAPRIDGGCHSPPPPPPSSPPPPPSRDRDLAAALLHGVKRERSAPCAAEQALAQRARASGTVDASCRAGERAQIGDGGDELATAATTAVVVRPARTEPTGVSEGCALARALSRWPSHGAGSGAQAAHVPTPAAALSAAPSVAAVPSASEVGAVTAAPAVAMRLRTANPFARRLS
jgi:hypothetical protein